MDFKIEEIYQKNINFLIGAGASGDIFPTLALKIEDETGQCVSIEQLAERFSNTNDPRLFPLFLHYYNTCIHPVEVFKLDDLKGDDAKIDNLNNYVSFIKTILIVLEKRQPLDKRCNVFTTNYDGCFTHAADKILQEGMSEFVINDGGRGFHKRVVEARNYSSFLCETGIFDRHLHGIPQLNLIHLHGSIYWKKFGDKILIDYSAERPNLISAELIESLKIFSDTLLGEGKKIDDLVNIDYEKAVEDEFWSKYKSLPIINPTKKKFYETVFEEHYYQMLRMMSYELEKPDSVFICFGFSFADEHILRLFKRSLANPRLCVYICCYSERSENFMREQFGVFRNVKLLRVDGKLDFNAFNRDVFRIEPIAPIGMKDLEAQ